MKLTISRIALLFSILLAGCSNPMATNAPIPHTTRTSTKIISTPYSEFETDQAQETWRPGIKINTLSPSTLPPDLQFQSQALTHLKAWKLFDLYDPAAPQVILPDDESFQLDSRWKVAKIEYVYTWMGHLTDEYKHTIIEKRGDQYYQGQESIPTQDVSDFLDSIQHLYPTQNSLASRNHTDDYPAWTIEIVGEDNYRVLLTSDSNSNPAAAPWNIYYNGRFYAQYDGSLYQSIVQLFGEMPRRVAATTYSGTGPLDFYAGDLDNGFQYGFSGFLPFDGPLGGWFRYNINPAQGIIEGKIRLFINDEVLGEPTRIDIHLPNKTIHPCDLEKITETESIDNTEYSYTRVYWNFVCQPGDFEPEQEFHYQLQIRFTKLETPVKGELWGVWNSEPPMLLIPPPPEILNPFLSDTSIQELLNNHALFHVSYSSKSRPDRTPPNSMTGRVTFLGETQNNQNTIRYIVYTPYEIKDGKVENFFLRNDSLSEYLARLLKLNFVKETIKDNKEIALAIYYSHAKYPSYFRTTLACPGNKTYELPNEEISSLGFTFANHFNSDGYSYSDIFPYSRFYLIGEQVFALSYSRLSEDAIQRLSKYGIVLCNLPKSKP